MLVYILKRALWISMYINCLLIWCLTLPIRLIWRFMVKEEYNTMNILKTVTDLYKGRIKTMVFCAWAVITVVITSIIISAGFVLSCQYYTKPTVYQSIPIDFQYQG